MKNTSNLAKDLINKRFLIYGLGETGKSVIRFFRQKKIKIIKIKRLKDKKDFYNLFSKIFKIGYGRVLVETGLIFLDQLFKYKLINDLYLFKSNKYLRNNGYNNCKKNFIKKLKLNEIVRVNLESDNLFKIRIK